MPTPTQVFQPRNSFKPFKYPWAYDLWLTHEQSHWLHTELPFAEDVADFSTNKLTPGEKNFLTHLFRFFTQGDIDVAEGYVRNYLPFFQQPEVRMMLLGFAARECFDEETQVLTAEGWKYFPDVSEIDSLAQFSINSHTISFTKALDLVRKPYSGVLHHYVSDRVDICVTPNHDLLIFNPTKGNIEKIKSKDLASKQGNWKFLQAGEGLRFEAEARISTLEKLQIALEARADLQGESTYCLPVRGHLEDDLLSWCSELGIEVEVRDELAYVELPHGTPYFRMNYSGMSPFVATEYLELMLAWQLDNHRFDEEISALAALSNLTLSEKYEKYPSPVAECPVAQEVPYDGVVYCATMPEGSLVTRRNGKVTIQGNCVHIAGYSHLVETLGLPESTYNEFLGYKEMVDKHEFLKVYTSVTDKFEPQRVVALSAFTEGLQLFSSFVMLLSFPRRGLMKSMGQIITWSTADETLHVEGVTRLFREVIKENKKLWTPEFQQEIYALAKTMVDLEFAFIDLAYSAGGASNLEKDDVKRYVMYIADRRLIQLGVKGLFKVKKNPLPWVDEMISSVTHTNFFENRGVEYAKGALTGSWGDVWGT